MNKVHGCKETRNHLRNIPASGSDSTPCEEVTDADLIALDALREPVHTVVPALTPEQKAFVAEYEAHEQGDRHEP